MSALVSPQVAKDVDIRQWLVASADGRRLLGRNRAALEGTDYDAMGRLRLLETYELVVFEVQAPGGQVARSVMVLAFDFAADGVPVVVTPSIVYRCADMTEADQRAYERFVRQGRDHAAKGRAFRAGLVTPARP